MSVKKMDEEISPKNSKSTKIFQLICIVIIFSFLVTALFYFFEIKPHVDTELIAFEERTRNISDPQTKIREIANFTEKNYFQTYGITPNFSYLGFDFLMILKKFVFGQDFFLPMIRILSRTLKPEPVGNLPIFLISLQLSLVSNPE
jgi:hypothetical protein